MGASAFQNSNSTHQIGLAVWGDDPATEEIDGTVEGEGIILRIWDGASETVIQPNWTEGKGVYETDGLICGEVSLENTRDNAHPDEFTLFGTFPNPFNSTTEIRYSIPEAGNIAVTLTDLEGREVARVWEGYETSGQHSVVLSGSELSAGVYFVHLTVGADSRMVKIVLIK